ncbi:MAG: hypothetical protein M3313_00380 [Actinomycetota bacterium]|nr:hypothetical protein [Actinomycetota bacterium]
MALPAVGLGLALMAVEPFPAPAQAVGCQASQIAVIVSFNELGGGTRTACIDDVDSGFAALDAAGYDVTPVAGQPFVCRINGVPANDPCQRIPPATAYWAYWTAPMGGSWSYATIGAGSQDPEPGGVQGWSFGADAEPAIAPPDPAPSTSAGAGESDTGSASRPSPASGTPRAASDSGVGTPWAVLGTIAGVAVLGGVAYLQQRRHRPGPPASASGPAP